MKDFGGTEGGVRGSTSATPLFPCMGVVLASSRETCDEGVVSPLSSSSLESEESRQMTSLGVAPDEGDGLGRLGAGLALRCC